GLLGAVDVQQRVQDFLGARLDVLREVLAAQDHPPAFVDDLALLVQHVVVIEELLADLEVVGLHLLLGVLDGPGHHLALYRDALLNRKSGLPPRRMLVPRPAMFVAMVTAPLRPAWAMISASLSCCLALRTLCFTPLRLKKPASRSDFSMEIVPTKTGWPRSWHSLISST